MTAQRYKSGEEIQLGDVVDIGQGNGPQGVVVVVIPSGPVAKGFTAEDWSYLKSGLMLQADGMGLVHYAQPNDELILVHRA